MQLDPVCYFDSTPRDRFVGAERNHIGAYDKRWLKRTCDALFQYVARERAHFLLDCFE